jgi:hypothetical protein
LTGGKLAVKSRSLDWPRVSQLDILPALKYLDNSNQTNKWSYLYKPPQLHFFYTIESTSHMIKIIIALFLFFPLFTPASTAESGPHDRSCAALSWPEFSKSVGELFEDDTNLVFGSPLSKYLHQRIDTAAMAPGCYHFDSKRRGDLNKKVLALFKLKSVFLI